MHQDIINAAFELVGAFIVWMNVWKLYQDSEIKGIYWPTFAFFAAWGLWNLYYYPSLGQWLSFGAGVLLVSGNIAWIAVAFKLKTIRINNEG